MKKTILSIFLLVFTLLSAIAQEMMDFNVVPLPRECVCTKR